MSTKQEVLQTQRKLLERMEREYAAAYDNYRDQQRKVSDEQIRLNRFRDNADELADEIDRLRLLVEALEEE